MKVQLNEKTTQFIEDNISLIEQNTRESWQKVYKLLHDDYDLEHGKFTEAMLECGLDPAEELGYIPGYYLSGSTISQYTIPDNCKRIGRYAFYECSNLESIHIPPSVRRICDCAFKKSGLRSIEIPNTVLSVEHSYGDGVFQGCSNLSSARVACPSLPWGMFKYCSKLEQLVLTTDVLHINSEILCEDLSELQYEGTMREWQDVDVDEPSLKRHSYIQRVVCTDGVIEL